MLYCIISYSIMLHKNILHSTMIMIFAIDHTAASDAYTTQFKNKLFSP